MFTQCSKCETIFKVSAEVLRVAGGQVRCGRCGEVFDAIARLAEQPDAFIVGESSLDLETRANHILETPAQDPGPAEQAAHGSDDSSLPGVEIAHLQFQNDSGDLPLEDDPSLEFTLPPGELDRVFVETKVLRPEHIVPSILPYDEAPAPVPAPAPAPAPVLAQASGVAQESAPEFVPATKAEAVDESNAAHAPAGAYTQTAAAETASSATPQPADLPYIPVAARPAPATRTWIGLWAAAAVALLVLLLAQIVHQNREWIAVNTPFGHALRTLYAKFGAPLPTPASLASYQLRQWGVTGEPDANGALHVRASILNTAAEFQPYPLLRVTLTDRFGTRIGTRDFAAAEYLNKPTARLLSPGERADATLNILDPGKDAEGFVIDVCLRGAGRRIQCADDAAGRSK